MGSATPQRKICASRYDFPSQARSAAASCFADSDAPGISEGALRCHVDADSRQSWLCQIRHRPQAGGDGYLGTGECSHLILRPLLGLALFRVNRSSRHVSSPGLAVIFS
ncbi:hypothetical protein V8C26DRAFT_272068 [Trichoderma gracile]